MHDKDFYENHGERGRFIDSQRRSWSWSQMVLGGS